MSVSERAPHTPSSPHGEREVCLKQSPTPPPPCFQSDREVQHQLLSLRQPPHQRISSRRPLLSAPSLSARLSPSQAAAWERAHGLPTPSLISTEHISPPTTRLSTLTAPDSIQRTQAPPP